MSFNLGVYFVSNVNRRKWIVQKTILRGIFVTQRYRMICILCCSPTSSVGSATGYGLDDRWVGVQVPVGSRIFFSPRRPDRHWGPPNLLSKGCRGALSQGVKRPGLEADHSLPASAEVTKIWIYKLIPPWRSA
jgi:hypothetical protein